MPTPYDSADPDFLEEIISQGEKRLQAQLELGKAADQRAMTFAGLLFAGVALLTGLAFGKDTDTSFQLELLGVLVGYILAAGIAGWSARSSGWDIIGNEPASYLGDIKTGLKLKDTRPQVAAHIQDMVSQNHRILAFNSILINTSMVIAVCCSLAGIFAALV